jgi:hypothetical protein
VDVSRRRIHQPSLAIMSATDDFSDVELDFFRRGDDLQPPAEDHAPAGDSAPDADA